MNDTITFHKGSLLVFYEYNTTINAMLSKFNPNWDVNLGGWLFSMSHHSELCEILEWFVITPQARDAIREWKDDQQFSSRSKIRDLPKLVELAEVHEKLLNGYTLFQHQKESVLWALKTLQSTTLRGVILALDMGLGKTLTSLTVAKAYQKLYNCKIIVVCPATLKRNWLNEADMVGVVAESHSWAKIPTPGDDEFILIADEAHYSQGGLKTQRGEKFLKLSKDTSCIATLMLSGTPMKNGRPINLLPLLQVANHPIAHNNTAYEKRYCAARPTPFCPWDTTGHSNLLELREKISTVMLRKTKAECLDLPAKTRIPKEAEVKGAALAAWKEAMGKAMAEYAILAELTPSAALTLIIRLRQAASAAKIDSTMDIAKQVLEEGRSIVIFTEFLTTAQALCDQMHKHKGDQQWGIEMLVGNVVVKKRQPMVDRFQSGESRVFISTFGAGGTGITLTKASEIILVERPWTPADAFQAEDRLHRIGCVNPVTAYWLTYSKIDQDIDKMIFDKQERAEIIMDGGKRGKAKKLPETPGDIAVWLAQEMFGEK